MLSNASLSMFDEQSFEWMFVVPEISGPDDPRVDELSDRCEVFLESHSGLNLVSTLTTGATAAAAARAAIGLLASCRLHAARTYPDLVTRVDIADRLKKRRQTVDNWVRGDRHEGFPKPVHLVGGGAWLWRDVRDWVDRERVRDIPDDEGVGYPTLADHALIDSELLRSAGVVSAGAPFVVANDAVYEITLGALRQEPRTTRHSFYVSMRDYALAE